MCVGHIICEYNNAFSISLRIKQFCKPNPSYYLDVDPKALLCSSLCILYKVHVQYTVAGLQYVRQAVISMIHTAETRGALSRAFPEEPV